MAIILPSGFNITNSDPVDARFSVASQAARLGFSAANVYEGLIVYQQDTNETYVLVDTANYNNTSGWQLVGMGAGGGTLIATGSVTASVSLTDSIFIIKSGSFSFITVSNSGSLTVSGSANSLFLVKSATNNTVFQVSQSGIVVLATQSVELTSAAPVGGMYFTSGSFFVGLE